LVHARSHTCPRLPKNSEFDWEFIPTIPRSAFWPAAHRLDCGGRSEILKGCDVTGNGLTFCVGSYGTRSDKDLVSMAREFAPRIQFVPLRQVTREADGSFYEAEHLNGSSDMVVVMHCLLEEEARPRRSHRADSEMPMRPDHGHLLADDIHKHSKSRIFTDRTAQGFGRITRRDSWAQARDPRTCELSRQILRRGSCKSFKERSQS